MDLDWADRPLSVAEYNFVAFYEIWVSSASKWAIFIFPGCPELLFFAISGDSIFDRVCGSHRNARSRGIRRPIFRERLFARHRQ